jgi:hypothetical protein
MFSTIVGKSSTFEEIFCRNGRAGRFSDYGLDNEEEYHHKLSSWNSEIGNLERSIF